MSTAMLVGIDLGKHSFHLHGQDKAGREVLRKKTTRQQMMRLLGNLPSCTVAMEACTGSHFLARQLITFGDLTSVRAALRQGQQERLHRCRGDL